MPSPGKSKGETHLIEQTWANEFAREWIDAWNSHDLDRILSHYVDDFEMSSPLIIERKKDPSGVLRGKTAIRNYWAIGLAAVPPIQFELIDVHVGVNTIGILYRSVGRRRVIELLTFNSDKQVIVGAASTEALLEDSMPLSLQRKQPFAIVSTESKALLA